MGLVFLLCVDLLSCSFLASSPDACSPAYRQDVLTQTQKVHIFHRGDEVFEKFSDYVGTVLREELE